MDYIKSIKLFVRVVETGSLSAAAKAAGVAQSTVSKELATLESHLKVQLIRRSPRSLSITVQGHEYYAFAVGLLTDLESMENRFQTANNSVSGRIRVACAPILAGRLIAPNLGFLFERHPELTIDLEVSERYVSLIEEGIDVAIRVGDLASSGLLARQIGSVTPVVVGTPGYFKAHGTPEKPDDLSKHNCLPFLFHGTSKMWRFKGNNKEINITPSGQLRSNDAESLEAAVYSGVGLVQGPRWMFERSISMGKLVPVLENWQSQHYPIHALRSGTRRTSENIKVFIDFVAEILSQEKFLRIIS